MPWGEDIKPIDQTKFGKDEGNCFDACLASIFEIPIEECSIGEIDYDTGNRKSDGKHWYLIFEQWCLKRGFIPVTLNPDFLGNQGPKGYSIISGKANRGLYHSTVGYDGKIVHDPHPSRDGLINIVDYIIFIELVKLESIKKS